MHRHGQEVAAGEHLKDEKDLLRRNSQAARQTLAELKEATPERIRNLADALLAAQPKACAAMLTAGSFRTGEVGATERRAVRDLHAIHRDSLVVFTP